MEKTVAFHSLGCKVNSYESEAMERDFVTRGFRVVPFHEAADVYVVNTCSVTNIADRKSRQMLHQAKRRNPDALVVAVGCYVETDTDAVRADTEVDLAVGNVDKGRVVERVVEFLGEASMPVEGVTWGTGTMSHFSECGEQPEMAGNNVTCVPVPAVTPLLRLLQRLHDIAGIERIRLSSLEPRIVTEEFAAGLAALPKVCPHFHLSLQSGDNATLMRMRRHYTVGEYRRSVEALRRVYKQPAITTDIICGFPGETKEQFQRTVSFAKEIGFYEIHVFPYSKRKGTAAASFEGQLTNAVKKERAAQLLALTAEQSKRYREQFIGKSIRVLWEDTEKIQGRTYLIGNTERYVRVARDVSALSAAEIDALSGTFEDGIAAAFLNDETLLFEA